MKKITVNVSDLADMVKELKKDKMTLVVVTFEDADPAPEASPGGSWREAPDEGLPACLTFHGTTDRDAPELVDYGEIEAEEDLRL
jgi:hypothetical protein